MLDFSRLSLFISVARAGSLTKAAQKMGTTAPVLSRKISALEAHIGGPLFIRNGRGLMLSELGENLLPKVEGLLREVDTLEADAQAAAGAAVGEVRIGMLVSFAGTIGIELMTRVAQDLPNVRLRIFEGATGRIDQWLDDGKIDIAVTLRDSSVEIGDVSTIGYLETYLVGKSGSKPLSSGEIDFVELKDLPLILSATQSGLLETLDEMAYKHNFKLDRRFEVDSAMIHLELARRGVGYAVLTPQAILPNIQEVDFSYARIVNPNIQRRLTLGNSVKHAPSAAVKEVMEIIEENGARLTTTGAWLKMGPKPTR